MTFLLWLFKIAILEGSSRWEKSKQVWFHRFHRANYKSTYDYFLSIEGRKKGYSANVNWKWINKWYSHNTRIQNADFSQRYQKTYPSSLLSLSNLCPWKIYVFIQQEFEQYLLWSRHSVPSTEYKLHEAVSMCHPKEPYN